MKIKKILFYIFCSVTFYIFSGIMILFSVIKWTVDTLLKKENRSFFDYLFDNIADSGNTIFEFECLDCGYRHNFKSGEGHTANCEETFSTILAYCPTCLKPVSQILFFNTKRNINEYCESCKRKVKEYKEGSNVNLKCPKCESTNTTITNKHSRWMT